MPRKKNKTRATAAEVLASFTREDITANIKERDAIATQVRKATEAIAAMRAAGMSDDHIQVIRDTVDAGALKRRAYLDAKLRRVAMAIFRSNTNITEYIRDNMNAIPTCDDKVARNAFIATATEV